MGLFSSLWRVGLFVRDRIAQGVADALVEHLGVGPFGIATGMLRIAAVLCAARVVSMAVSGAPHGSRSVGLFDAVIFCWLSTTWSIETAKASRRPPKAGSATVCRLHGDSYLILVVLVVPFTAWDVGDLCFSGSLSEALHQGADILQNVGLLMGTTVWRDLPRRERRSLRPALSVG